MKVLVTGANGFIGTKLLESLSREFGNDNIITLSSKIHPNYKTVTYSSKFTLDSNIKLLENVSHIIHAGAFTPKCAADSNNVEQCNGNISFTDMLLKVNFKELKKITFLSTLDVYGYSKLLNEESPVIPVSLYGDSKYYCEKMIETYCVNHSIVCQILRIGHVYGPGEEKYKKLIPVAIQKMLRQQTLDLWGDGEELRTYIYIDDVIKACLTAMKLNDNVGIINVCGSQSISTYNLLVKISKIIGCELKLKKISMSRQPRNLVFDNQKMQKYLLNTELPFEDGLLEEIEYLKAKL